MQLRPIFGACAGLFLAAAASAQTVTTVVNNGPTSELYDMVIIGDGYRAAEQALFNQNVADVVDYFQNQASLFPYGDYFQCYNVHTVFRASVESGADDPCANPVITRNTVYDAEYCWGGTQRCLYIRNTAQAAADVALAPDTDGRVIVLVNDSQYGGCASTYAVSYNGASMEEVNAHEWGHSFGLVSDEYDYGNTGPYVGGEPTSINCTASTTGNAKWPMWVGAAGQYGTVGAYPGACYYPPTPLPTLYRPEPNCEMRALGLRFCTICREQIIKRFHEEVVMIDNPLRSPAGAVGQFNNVSFSFVNRIANRPHTIEWRIDAGSYFAGTTNFIWNVGAATVGNHTITLRLTDTSTQVRNDPGNLLVHTFAWVVNVTSGSADARCSVEEVVPDAYTSTEANSSSGFPFGSGTERRVMMAYGGTALGASAPVRFDGMMFRPNGGVTTTNAASYRLQLYLSTSRNPAQALSYTFEANHGADRVLVFNGTAAVAAGPSGGTPEDWLLHVPFTRPFEWDPACGPLLVDIRYLSSSGVATTGWDGPFNTSDDVGRIVHQTDSNAATADFPGGAGNPTQNFALVARLCVECEVAPNAYATTEAGSSSAYPWSQANSRTLMAYAGSVFPGTFDGRYRISRLAFRPDAGGALGRVIYDMRITMSTGVTPANALSPTFDANHGADRRIVFDGRYTAGGNGGGTSPAGFDLGIELESSFEYQPSAGPLVIDVVMRGIAGAPGTNWDGPFNTGELVGRVYATSSTATTGTSQNFALVLCVSGERCPTVPEASDSAFGTSSAYPWGATQRMRAQYVYDGTALATTEPIYIQHMRWRPQFSATSIGPVTYDVRINVSTSNLTSASALTTTFLTNHSRAIETVFDGQFSVPLTSLSGNPRDFPISVKLDTPYYWNPLTGPLVVDLIYRGASGTGLRNCDGPTVGSQPVYRVVHLTNPSATTADFGPQQFGFALSLCGVNCNALAVNYGVACAGSNGTPVNTTVGLPSIPNPTFRYRLSQGPISQTAALWLGFNPVSIDLTGIGANTCWLLNTVDLVAVTTATNSSGDAFVPSPIPNDPLIDGATVYSQWIAIDPGAARPLRIVTSDGQRITLCF